MEYVYGKEQLLPRVAEVEVCPEYQLLLTFRNGEKRVFDMRPYLTMPAYRTLRAVFASGQVAFGTVVWPGDVDISPETLYLKSVPVEYAKEA